jgi:hypothetical protein
MASITSMLPIDVVAQYASPLIAIIVVPAMVAYAAYDQGGFV